MNAVWAVASAFGYSTEYIMEHSLLWLKSALRYMGEDSAKNYSEVTEESKENLMNIGILYDKQ
ncbi:hypothetical protein [Parelusimicrobium proximum]|uniref:hypothetical protein n=1 Tax=Parelusimicrobium proximum TaxID=3228953 RepID=UPI003D18140E